LQAGAQGVDLAPQGLGGDPAGGAADAPVGAEQEFDPIGEQDRIEDGGARRQALQMAGAQPGVGHAAVGEIILEFRHPEPLDHVPRLEQQAGSAPPPQFFSD
jgi:hypothetical protein